MARKDAILRLHSLLVSKRDALRGKNTADRKLNRTTSRGGDVGDAALRAEHAELNNQIAAFESRELAMIEKAILLIKTGRYGKCEVCNKSIPIQRLKALPFTPYCVSCQTELEESGDWPGEASADWETACEFEGRMSDRDLTMKDIDIPS
jgi:DnaK suppressor protein